MKEDIETNARKGSRIAYPKMNPSARQTRALGLCSGGLDSILAGLVLRAQGIRVEWVVFTTPFFSAEKAKAASRQTGIPLSVHDITPVYIEMLKSPRAGYGKNMNPCMDCHALMFRLAGEIMAERGFDFLFSGEVLGQRPMSQRRPSLNYVEKHSGMAGYILRPLSAQRLPETVPEQQGLVDRSRLMGLSGRSRKAQIALAGQFGISDYPAPAGGCLLTDPNYSRRLKDLFDHGHELTGTELELLKFGRHLRLVDGTKIIVGRTFQDNQQILRHVDPTVDTVIRMVEFPGPVVLVPGGGSPQGIRLAAGICAGYSKAPADAPADVSITASGDEKILSVIPESPDSLKSLMI
ncbi:MAG: tRNA 4-thiouridine(8) synthase ThiI [Desulfobacterales bacterium]